MSDLARPMPDSFSKRQSGVALLGDGQDSGGFAAKIKIRFLVEKFIDNEWLMMARLPEAADRITELCEALGGKIRVLDVASGLMVLEEEFE